MVPVKGTNMHQIYAFGQNSTEPKQDDSLKILDETILVHVNETKPTIRVACPTIWGGQNETAEHQRTLLTIKGQLLQPEKYYKESLYK